MKLNKMFFVMICVLFLSVCHVKASNFYIYSSDKDNIITVGDTISITAKLDLIEGGIIFSSSDTSILSGGEAYDWIDSGSVTEYFKAQNPGKVTITVKTKNATTMDPGDEKDFSATRTITVTVIKKAVKPPIDVNKVYDKNNYLKNLTINGYELTPSFNKSTQEYSVELTPGTEEIEIGAVLESNKAKVKGIGKIKVTEGINTINVTVTAENGNERVYKILAKVDEKDPINIKIEGKKYTVVKRKELIGNKTGYEDTEVKIESFDIPALYNDVTKITLVGVKDEDGNVTLVSYDSKKGEYGLYKEFGFDVMNLYIHKNKESVYEEVEIKLNGTDITAYKLGDSKEYYLLYATNTSTGYEGYYLYDKKENSVQRYDTTVLDDVTHTKDKFLSIVLVLSCVCFLTMLFLLIEVNRDNKRNLEG